MDPAANGLEEGIQSIGDLLTQRQRKRFKAGDTLLGRYRILDELGQGGMGLVFRCMDEIGGIEVAVKMLPPEVSHDSGEMEDVRENFRLVSSLVHQNICAVRTLEKDPATGEYFLVMELAQGVNLRQWRKGRALSPKAPGSGSERGGLGQPALPLEQILPIVRQIAAALDYAHAHKVIHRDIKPSNVMVDTSAFGLQSSACTVKVLDFGLAAQIHTSFSRVSHVRYGTSGTGPYMAPEQWEGQYQDAATDQYALAVLTYELLTGHCPFESHEATVLRESVLKSAPRCPPGLPAAAWAVLKRGLAKEREERFASCGEFARALGGERIQLRNLPSQRHGTRKGNGWKWSAGLILLAGLAAGGAWKAGWIGSVGRANPPGEPELGLIVGGGVDSARLEGRALSRKAPGTEEEDGGFSQSALPEPPDGSVVGQGGDLADSDSGTAPDSLPKATENPTSTGGAGVPMAESSVDNGTWVDLKTPPMKAEDKVTIPKTADQGDALEQFKLGKNYAEGCGVAKDETKAVELFLKAADQGLADAQIYLGWMYENSLGVPKDEAKAVELYRKAADQGNALAQVNLGLMYQNGLGVPKDEAKAVELYRKAADQGNADGQRNLGLMYQNGLGVPKDEAKAVELYRKAADQGNALAKVNLGVMYQNGLGVPKDEAKAVELYRKAADQGNADGQRNLGVMYQNGLGVAKDKSKAVELYRKAADQGNKDEAKAVELRSVNLGSGVTLDLVWITPGSFTMGVEQGRDESPPRRVTFAHGFWMGQTEVTQAQYARVMGGKNPSRWKGDNLPVENVSWNDAQKFCQEASRILGKEVRLPSEAEWEYACRAGTTTQFHYGESLDATMANFNGNYPFGIRKGPNRQQTMPVKSCRPNAWGLYDMHGNVWEWCEDWYRDSYNGAPTDGSPWLSPAGKSRVLRGGSWNCIGFFCRSGYRARRHPGDARIFLGFRVVVSLVDS